MAIDANCPFCQKAYKLKDDLLGKKVTCANQTCRKVFEVAPSKNGKPPATAVAEPPPPPPSLDADAVAAAALADEVDATPADERTVEMTCSTCDHKWQVPWASIGKNVLCPDCKTRQKVPEPKAAKKVDWRTGAGRPSLAKVEELAGVQASTDNRMVSGDTLLKTGVIGVEYEPRPTSFYVKFGLLGGALVAVVAFGVMYGFRSRDKGKQDKLSDDVLKAVDAEELKQLPPNVAPSFRGALLLAAAEHEARLGEQKRIEAAIDHFNRARTELERSPRSGDRDAVLATLPVTLLALGGDDGQVERHERLPWVPRQPKPGEKARIKPSAAEAEGVQGQLRRAFEAMKSDKVGVEFEFRVGAARQVTRGLAKFNQSQMLLDTLQAGFFDQEQAEVKGQVGLELLRAGQKDAARDVAESLKGAVVVAPGGTPPASVQALWLAVEPPTAGVPQLVAPPPASGPVQDGSRLAYTALYLVQGKTTEARELASRTPGSAEVRLKALALGAEWSDTPGPFVEDALKVVAEEQKKPEPKMPAGPVLIRLAADAGRANMADAATKLAEATLDDGLREWAKAEATRARLAVDRGREATDADAPLPEDPKKYRVGHAAARFHVARHNASRTGDRSLAGTYAKNWPAGLIAPFGQAGVALGVQDTVAK